MMKTILSIFLLISIISGCANHSPVLDDNFDGWTLINGTIPTANNDFSQFENRKLAYRYESDTYTVYIKTDGEAYNRDANWSGERGPGNSLYSRFYPNLCYQLFGTKVKVKNNNYYKTAATIGVNFYYYPQITSATCYSPDEQENKIKKAKLKNEKREMQQKGRAIQAQLRVLEGKKEKCREYGFKDDTDGMGLCLIELDKLAVIEQQKNLQIQQQAIKNKAIARQQADAQRQRESQALINLGNMLMNMGTPAPVNRRNEEVKGMDKICYYETVTGKKALTISAAELCPLSYPY